MSKRSPLVTIWVCSYNHARYLPQCLESALSQTVDDVEVLVVDDGSTDGSLEIARTYLEAYPNKLRIYTHEGHKNQGISRTVNFAASLARGQFVCGLPSDDWLPLNAIETRLHVLEGHPEAGWVYGRVQGYSEINDTYFDKGHHDLTKDPDPYGTFASANPVYGMSVLARAEIWRETGDHDPFLVYSDWDFWARMFAISTPVYCTKSTAIHRHHETNTSIGISNRRGWQHETEVLKKFLQWFPASSSQFRDPVNIARASFELACLKYLLEDMDGAREAWSSMKNSLGEKFEKSREVSWWTRRLSALPRFSRSRLDAILSTYADACHPESGISHLAAHLHAEGRRTSRFKRIRQLYKDGELSKARGLTTRTLLSDPSSLLDGRRFRIAVRGLLSRVLPF